MLTDGTAGADRARRGVGHGTPGSRSVAGWLRREANLTGRMMADDSFIAVLPIVFSVAAGAYAGRPAVELLAGVGKAVVLALLFVYVFVSVNQARSGAEDALNKPYRPVPAGLVTPKGLGRRFWVAMVVYPVLGWVFGAWPWPLLWQVTTLVVHSRWASPRYYLWWKTPMNISGAVTTLATGWQVSAPLGATAWTWIATVSLYFPLAMIFEDVRDMDGDRAIGRRTPALVFGPTFVRRWFATFSALLPCVVYFGLARPSGAGDWRGVISAVVLGILSWTCAARALRRHSRSADRLTLQLFFLTWVLTLASAPFLLAKA
ncbi:UbiA family prenyltransferase [Amycolatopsis sp. NPDC023774]|uniref:UbiA family prenyltransferase n=1 Tax=Amycolatopsis sp. NPDC023774 TaxID=3155015 RepID=UPI0033D71BF6